MVDLAGLAWTWYFRYSSRLRRAITFLTSNLRRQHNPISYRVFYVDSASWALRKYTNWWSWELLDSEWLFLPEKYYKSPWSKDQSHKISTLAEKYAGIPQSKLSRSSFSFRWGGCFIFLFLIHGFFLALKLAGVRGQKKLPTLSTREGTDLITEQWERYPHARNIR